MLSTNFNTSARAILPFRPFSYYKDFFGRLSLREQVERYAVTGGVPKYIESFSECEDICRELLHTDTALPHHFSKIGRYWDKNTEIDIVALDEEKNVILFNECKFLEQPVDTDVFYDLVEKSKRVTWQRGNRRELFVLFSVSGYTERSEKMAAERGDLMLK